MYNPKRALVKKLRSEGKTYEQITNLANCSIGFAYKWGKYGNRERENLHVNTLTPSVKIRPTPSVNVNVKNVKTPLTNSSSRSSSPVNVKKSISVGRGMLLVLLIIGAFCLFAWIYLVPEKKEENPDLENKTFGYDDRSVEDLG